MKSSQPRTSTVGSPCTIVTFCRLTKLLGRTAWIIGTAVTPRAGVKVKLATATSLSFWNPATAIVHCAATPATPSAVSSAHPNQKEWKSNDLRLDPGYMTVREGVPFVVCCSTAVKIRFGGLCGCKLTAEGLSRTQELKNWGGFEALALMILQRDKDERNGVSEMKQ